MPLREQEQRQSQYITDNKSFNLHQSTNRCRSTFQSCSFYSALPGELPSRNYRTCPVGNWKQMTEQRLAQQKISRRTRWWAENESRLCARNHESHYRR